MAVKFSEQAQREFEEILKRYPERQAAILPTLHLAQREFGYISPEVVEYVSDLLGFTPARIYGVVTFYTMYNRNPVGKYHLQVCRNISCSLLGAKHIIEHLTEKLGIKPGETTPDGKFTLSLVECLGSCGTAPVMQINDDYYENLTVEKVDEILEKLE
ncbi:MAG: NADH-quinone oxidoreductase subunit NuoE [Deltaproteobacteria bacterium]|nr:MAG: NADH-quinone oxidoreductase subunit NuoE [Deltaproteobacteria bacterium]